MPKVSIIIPAYNCAHVISRTIQSVLNQTFTDWELIIVDDGSRDSLQDVVSTFQDKDARIKYHRQSNSGGPASPKNAGIKNASGEYIAFLDHDDEWLPKKLEKQLSLFAKEKSENIGLTASDAIIINEIDNSKTEYKLLYPKDVTAALLERNFIFCSSGVIVRKEVFSEIGFFDENFKLGDDWDMWLRISLKYKCDFIPEPLYYFYRHHATVTNTMKLDTKGRDYDYGLAKHIETYKRYPKQLNIRLLTMARMCYIAGERKRGILLFAKAISAYPFGWKAYVNLFFALLGRQAYYTFLQLRNTKN